MSALPSLLEWARHSARRAGLAPPLILRIELVLEELFTNSVQHGYGGDSDQRIWLQAAAAPGSLHLTYQDAAPPYDPIKHAEPIPDDPAERRFGGLGAHLIRRLSGQIEYRRAGRRNVITLRFPAARGPEEQSSERA